MSFPKYMVIFNKPPPSTVKRGFESVKNIGIKGGQVIREKAQQLKKIEQKPQEKNNGEKLQDLTKNSNKILCRAKAIFPFDLFPDEITVESSQINVIMREFFFSETVISIPIKNMADILIETSPFFATIKIIDIAFKSDPVTVRFLHKADAKKIRRVIQGLIIADKQHVDISQFEPYHITPRAEVIGTAPGYE